MNIKTIYGLYFLTFALVLLNKKIKKEERK
jgi:hypothetical protein